MGKQSITGSWWFCWALSVFVLLPSACALTADGEALLELKLGFNDSKQMLRSWRPSDSDPCSWLGVACHLSDLTVRSINLPYMQLGGIISPSIGRLRRLQRLALHQNSFHGPIPPEIKNCTELKALYLRANYLQGSIPPEIGELAHLTILDLSSNLLRGAIPPSIGRLTQLRFLNLSTNFFSGEIPTVGVLASFRNTSFVGNLELCGLTIQKVCRGSMGFPAVLPHTNTFSSPGMNLIDPDKKIITFSEWGTKLVTFHGNLPYPSQEIIKKLELLDEDDVIENGGEDQPLNWNARMKIALGSARGLAYLHHDCTPRIVHRDIKSSNILLDRSLEPHVSDFGLAKLLVDDDAHVTTVVAGTFGYLAPEYLQNGHATEKSDVYSFGVLLLELVTGKRPTDPAFVRRGLNIVGWLNTLEEENRLEEIVDEKCGNVDVEAVEAILDIAAMCTDANPDERPSMSRVLQMLEEEIMSPCLSDFYEPHLDI
ncbi:hypothetical protein C4D60_Mb04t29510 [Musa balbisiana]|uniref:non-specific serine/threonine protein kinase n=1 Tax=Musa balbisiana TaxID=52838 RepID=A0A4S8KFJ0_MUSBA|nr:hypothetical protein C4D60_Mb04t29510 [Musa balbisiana]